MNRKYAIGMGLALIIGVVGLKGSGNADGPREIEDGCTGEVVMVPGDEPVAAAAVAATGEPEAQEAAAEPAEVPEPTLQAGGPPATPIPTRWVHDPSERCGRRSGRYYCDGPLRTPEPHGEAEERALELGLGTRRVASQLLLHPPNQEWVDAVHGQTRRDLHWPVDGGRFWRGFGHTRQGQNSHRIHKGVDIGCSTGTRILAVNDAIVAYANNRVVGYGNLIQLVHADGSVSFYAHLSASYVFPGQRVKRGQVIGLSGTTGITRGPHLHFEWRVEGRPRNPMRMFPGRDTSGRPELPPRGLRPPTFQPPPQPEAEPTAGAEAEPGTEPTTAPAPNTPAPE